MNMGRESESPKRYEGRKGILKIKKNRLEETFVF